MNRHADALSDFTECVQAALNRNGHKPSLESMKAYEIIQKLEEEERELVAEIRSILRMRYFWWMPRWILKLFRPPNIIQVEREAADLAVCALAAFIWARQGGKVGDGISER